MENKEEVVKTDVDKLLMFLREKKIITMADLAKETGMPFKTVQALTGLLEEENMVHITYKFTTPYVNYGPAKTKGKAAKSQTEGEKALFAMEQEDNTPKILEPTHKAEIKSLEPSTIKSQTSDSQIKKTDSSITAKKESTEIKETTPETAKEEDTNISSIGKQSKPKEEYPEILITDNIEELVSQANKLIQEGNLEKAREIFLAIKRKKSNLPKEFLEKEKKLKEHLLKLNEVLILGIDKAMTSEFTKKYEEIQHIFENINSYITENKINSKENLETIERLYAGAKEIYLNLPEGFVERRVEIQDKLLELYKTIISCKKTILTQEFQESSNKIINMMQSITGMINKNDIENAGKLLNEANIIYASLPAGFLKEKTELQNKILELYQKYILNKESSSAKSMQEKERKISSLIEESMEAANDNNLEKAKKLYVKATDIYSELPKGFLEVKAELEGKMIDLYHLISFKLNNTLMEDAQIKISSIKQLLTKAGEYIASKEFDLAKETYMEIIHNYNSLPSGFSELQQLRIDILNLYKAIMPSIAETPLSDFDDESIRKYNEILKLLINIHEDIKNKNFGEIKTKYLMAYKLYHELPIGFLEGKTGVYTEILKVYQELKLYTEVNKLAELADADKFDKLKESLDMINSEYTTLSAKYPEDKELFDFIKNKYMIYLDLLKKHFDQLKESGDEVRDRINAISKKENIKDESLPNNFNESVDKFKNRDRLDLGIIHTGMQDNNLTEKLQITSIPEVKAEPKVDLVKEQLNFH